MERWSCSSLPESKELSDHPFWFEKDGAFLYSTTDIATVQYRIPSGSGEGVSGYLRCGCPPIAAFQAAFEVARQMGHPDVSFEHVGFGMMLGKDGKPFKTRDGGTVTLASLLDEPKRESYPKCRKMAGCC